VWCKFAVAAEVLGTHFFCTQHTGSDFFTQQSNCTSLLLMLLMLS